MYVRHMHAWCLQNQRVSDHLELPRHVGDRDGTQVLSKVGSPLSHISPHCILWLFKIKLPVKVPTALNNIFKERTKTPNVKCVCRKQIQEHWRTASKRSFESQSRKFHEVCSSQEMTVMTSVCPPHSACLYTGRLLMFLSLQYKTKTTKASLHLILRESSQRLLHRMLAIVNP